MKPSNIVLCSDLIYVYLGVYHASRDSSLENFIYFFNYSTRDASKKLLYWVRLIRELRREGREGREEFNGGDGRDFGNVIKFAPLLF